MDSSRFDRLSRSLAGATTRRAALLALLGGLLPFVVSAAGTGATGRRSNHRGHRGRGPDARSDRARGRDQRGGAQAEKKKPKKKKKASPCPRAKSRCGALCVDTASDASNCGSCGAACAAGQTCRGGTCTCNGERCTGCCDGMTCLPGASEAQCGSGGVACLACSGGRTCENGSCACPPGHDVCADTCVDRQTNLSHCGECGRGCAQSETCRGGVCGVDCGTGFCAATGTSPDCCGGACRNLSTDVNHCGTCGRDCDEDQTADRCVAGNCRCGNGGPCPRDQTCCAGACRDLGSDVAHCGACGRVCSFANAEAICTAGDCGFACQTGFADCNEVASDGCEVDTRTDEVHCGTCGAACGVSETCCDGICRPLNTDEAHCGNCGTACGAGETCCSGVCRNLGTSVSNCGTCGHACDSQTADRCVGGICHCGSGDPCPGEDHTCQGGVCAPRPCDVCASGCAFTSVQAAINAVGPGGTVVVCPGDYRENLFIRADRRLIGAGDGSSALDTILRGTGNGPVVEIAEGATVTLKQLRITGGRDQVGLGGGINNWGTTTAVGCTIIGNASRNLGGGLSNTEGALTLTGCTVAGNTAERRGGGIDTWLGTLALSDSIVTDNAVGTVVDTGGGGGIHSYGGTMTLTDCTISENTSNLIGGGIYTELSGVTLTDCTVSENTADNDALGFSTGVQGGGIASDYSTMTLTRCTVSGNVADSGGGIYMQDYSPGIGMLKLVDSEVSGNQAPRNSGGGIFGAGGKVELVNSVVSENSTCCDAVFSRGGGMFVLGTAVKFDEDSRVEQNAAAAPGGGIYNHSGAVDLDNPDNVTGNSPNNCAGVPVPECED
jgi:hypothetical protein